MILLALACAALASLLWTSWAAYAGWVTMKHISRELAVLRLQVENLSRATKSSRRDWSDDNRFTQFDWKKPL